jgi:flagellar basal-body rod protein FlgC
MDLFEVFSISAAGMSVEQARLGAAASNLANVRTSRTADGHVYQPLSVVVRSQSSSAGSHAASFDTLVAADAAALPRPIVASIEANRAPPRLVYDPGHPDADQRGFVSLPGVDPLGTMLELISVSRAYEANLRAFDLTRSLIQRTLEMGRNS